jgi:hypothetical protein
MAFFAASNRQNKQRTEHHLNCRFPQPALRQVSMAWRTGYSSPFGIMPLHRTVKSGVHCFYLLSGAQSAPTAFISFKSGATIPTGLLLALILSLFSIIFGARRLFHQSAMKVYCGSGFRVTG